ncbi:MAG: hypothetical protein AAB091_06800 [Elusimicrobiota bacterium]
MIFVNSAAVSANGAWTSPLGWTLSGGYLYEEETPVISVGETSVITVPGGASYLSAASSRLHLKARQEALIVSLGLPRSEYLGWSFQAGSVSYQVSIPSGNTSNQLSRSQGAFVGVGLDIDVVRRTMVTPRVNARLSWRWAQTHPDRIYFGSENRWETVEDLWQTTRTALGVMVEPSWKNGAIVPNAGFEMFHKIAALKDGRSGEVFSGRQNGYRIFGGVEWRFSNREAAVAQVSLGDETGYRITLEQRF